MDRRSCRGRGPWKNEKKKDHCGDRFDGGAGFCLKRALSYGRHQAQYAVDGTIPYATQQSFSRYLSGYFLDNPIWIRDIYFVPRLPGRDWTFWQYTDKGKRDGYRGTEKYIDINVFRGDEEELLEICIG